MRTDLVPDLKGNDLSDVNPPNARQRTIPVVANLAIARDTFRLRLLDPAMAQAIRPGQFLMVRPTGGSDPLLGRPFAVYEVIRDADGHAKALDIVYQVVGAGTQALARLREGDQATIWGPLGNGFGPGPGRDQSVVFVAGGIGQTPFLALGRWWLGQAIYGTEHGPTPTPSASAATLLYGIRSADLAAGLDDFRDAGIEVELATDDGSTGHHGFVTDLLSRRLERGDRPAQVIGCGPPAMLATLTRLTARHGVNCLVSLENHMACGFGVCFSCVASIRQVDGSTDLRRVCVEGPIFPAESVAWPEARPLALS